jgi:hypothetical protein
MPRHLAPPKANLPRHLVVTLDMKLLHLDLDGVELHHFYAETLVIVEQNALSNRRYSRRIRI